MFTCINQVWWKWSSFHLQTKQEWIRPPLMGRSRDADLGMRLITRLTDYVWCVLLVLDILVCVTVRSCKESGTRFTPKSRNSVCLFRKQTTCKNDKIKEMKNVIKARAIGIIVKHFVKQALCIYKWNITYVSTFNDRL